MATLTKGTSGNAVRKLQRLLNVALDRQPPLRTDGGFGDQTAAAVADFQNWARLSVTGAVDDAQMELLLSVAERRGWQDRPRASARSEPLWLAIAHGEEGQTERAGAEQNPRILDYIATFPYLRRVSGWTASTMAEQDETPWCACFVNWCLLRAGQLGGTGATAESWKTYGRALSSPVPGCLAILYSTPRRNESGFHVGFFAGRANGKVKLFGGNQSNKVCEKSFAYERITYRWPGG